MEWDRDGAVLAAVARSAVALVVIDAGGVVVRWSPGAERLFARSAAEVVGRHWVDVGFVADPVRSRRITETLDAGLAGRTVAGEWTARRPDGTTIRVHSAQEPILDESADKVIGVVSISFDLTEREDFEAALVREALLDRLTGLPGRSVLDHDLATRIAAADQGASPCAAVLYIDLDRFKAVNDTYGHDAGDRVLKAVARRLRAAVRGDDLVARVGGDEFVVLVPLQAGDTPAEVTTRVRGALADPVEVGQEGAAVDVTASIGVILVAPGDDPADVMRRADAAMYAAKVAAAPEP